MYTVDGSSPRMRGKLWLLLVQARGAGFIPAHAGKTSPCRFGLGRDSVHPRACGENWWCRTKVATSRGSSPRMRGKPAEGAGGADARRFIPAHAGKTDAAGVHPHRQQVHPRACGENSSPFWGVLGSFWFIPAHAGKTAVVPGGSWTPEVHPRACGENLDPACAVEGRCGSSPRMRGKPDPDGNTKTVDRFIPAHAGKTPSGKGGSVLDSVHPRACGENDASVYGRVHEVGSSPRMRGKRECLDWLGLAFRFIPAHAGKTFVWLLWNGFPWVHPRACGENEMLVDHVRVWQGSSPRMRGKHPQRRAHAPTCGFIPAHAGKTP